MDEISTYLDHAATTPILPEARAAMAEGFAIWANPSSPHASGRKARAALEDARRRMAESLGWTGEVVFVSGASEAIAIAVERCSLNLSAVSPVEHDAVLRHAEGVRRLPVDACGRVDPEAAATGGLVAVQHANSETGVLQPVAGIADTVRATGGLLLADCSQSAGKTALPDADMIALSAHKFGGPIGIGALLVRDGAMLKPSGGQERGYRAGTENLPGAMAMAAALEAGSEWMDEAGRLRQLLEREVVPLGGEVVASDAERIPTIGAIRMPGMAAAVQLIRFDAAGIAVSAGSACSSGSLRTSHVLAAMGIDGNSASETIRVSIGRETGEDDIARFLETWKDIAAGRRAAA
ncbi:cysteine desulfurase [Novosphingobium marinum]|uniref:Cysteine desulfurase n=1 Tax=Novosphingobium marinum TaxID=1514948 RepID=A0A7Y9XW55_9SPHN|nr:aminotransferase class V-fold PLP-dependent enzyme [Novosphingobium marinum]NYH94418.1 cysteine desulfurase [Novosphingobium marinum]GGC22197.1 cysteine desulfurase [Novosphingobium marinum]